MRSSLPKVLHSICGRSLLGHAIAAAGGVNPEHIVVVVRHDRDRVAAHALSCDKRVIIADQDDIPGTGRAVWCALEALAQRDVTHGNVLVMAGDTPLLNAATLEGLYDAHDQAVTLASTIVKDATGYGRVLRDGKGMICGVVEHKDANASQRAIVEINTSTYAFDLTFLRESLSGISTSNAQGEMYLTDVVADAYQRAGGVSSYVIADSTLVEGCNDLVQLAALRVEMTRRINEDWMRQGVSILSPEQTWIDVTAQLEADAIIQPGTHLEGATVVEAGVNIGPGTFRNVHIGAGAEAHYAYVENCRIGAGEKLVPFTVLPEPLMGAGETA